MVATRKVSGKALATEAVEAPAKAKSSRSRSKRAASPAAAEVAVESEPVKKGTRAHGNTGDSYGLGGRKSASGSKASPAVKAVPLIVEEPIESAPVKKKKSSEVSARRAAKAASASPAPSAAPEKAASCKSSCSVICAGFVRCWLILYNAVSAFGWLYLLYQLAQVYFASEPYQQNCHKLAQHTSEYLCLLQAAALLEVVHAALGWVRSSVLSTVMQVASRLFVSWVAVREGGVGAHWAYGTMAVSWALSDSTRYLYYLSQLLGCRACLLKFARYTLFLVLYPVGTLSEAILIFLARLKWLADPLRSYLLLAVLAIYTPGFLYMYSHMLSQRAKHL